MNNLIKSDTINFSELVKSGNKNVLSESLQSTMVKTLNQEFTDEEQRWYIANLYVYMNYHPTNDFPINLDHVFKMIGFANKGNAMKTIKSNFVVDEDYKVALFHTEKRKNEGGHNKEDIMLSVDTFKNLCMIVKTDKGKAIRKYYVKLENIYNKLIQEEIQKKEELLIKERENANKEKENATKLLEEKDKYIAQLKEKELVPILYIAHNPIIKNKHKIGISSETKTNDILVRKENHKSSNPDFEFLFTYETPNAKLIEDFIKLILKPFKLQKPEWFSITYERMKQVVDFAIMVYDNYHVEESIENVVEFISRYRSNRLINTNKARIHVSKDIYEEWFKENSVMIPGAKISTELICNDFYEWYQLRYPNENAHTKLDTGNWSTSFQKEITNAISEITKLEYKQRLSFSDRKRNIYFPNCAGFIGFEVKSMNENKVEFFDSIIYQRYVDEFITITNDPRNKVAKKEIIDHFLVWVKNNNFITKNRIMCRTAISTIFKDHFIKTIENLTGLKAQDTYIGCFTGMNHTEFPFTGQDQGLSDNEIMKKRLDSWINPENNDNISKIFKKIVAQNNQITKEEVRTMMRSKYNVDLTLNRKKLKWNLIFGKHDDIFYVLPDALSYYTTAVKKNEN
jgi:phage anti-repressor protein